MKVFASTLFVLILAGCSPDTAIMEAAKSGNIHKNGTSLPDNPANSHDSCGALYSTLLDSYYQQATSPQTLQEVIGQGETIAFLNPSFQVLEATEPYTTINATNVLPYLGAGVQNIRSMLATAYSTAAKDAYESISNELTVLKAANAEYEEAYEALTAFEASIKIAPNITSAERKAILTTASILRNALHHDAKRKRRDRDWEWMTGHCAATANAALESSSQAILMSFATDVYQN